MQIQQLALAASAVVLASTSSTVGAVTRPEQAQVSFKAMDYQDRQHDLSRIGVKALSSYWVVPIGASWALEAGTVVDASSGASPA